MPIEALQEDGANFRGWAMDVKALLRGCEPDLWLPIQTKMSAAELGDATSDVAHKRILHARAADKIVPFLSPGVKRRLGQEEFDDGELIMSTLYAIFSSSTPEAFMRYHRELFALDLNAIGGTDAADTLSIQIRGLTEKIDACNTAFVGDLRHVLLLSNAISGTPFAYLISIWSVMTPSPQRAENMLKDAMSRHEEWKGNPWKPARELPVRSMGEHCTQHE